MTILEHCHRAECTQVVGALQRRIKDLEAALDVALEALEKHSTSLLNHEDEYAEAIAKLKEVRGK